MKTFCTVFLLTCTILIPLNKSRVNSQDVTVENFQNIHFNICAFPNSSFLHTSYFIK